MLFDFLHFTFNLVLALFALRYAQTTLIEKDSDFGKALSYLLH